MACVVRRRRVQFNTTSPSDQDAYRRKATASPSELSAHVQPDACTSLGRAIIRICNHWLRGIEYASVEFEKRRFNSKKPQNQAHKSKAVRFRRGLRSRQPAASRDT